MFWRVGLWGQNRAANKFAYLIMHKKKNSVNCFLKLSKSGVRILFKICWQIKNENVNKNKEKINNTHTQNAASAPPPRYLKQNSRMPNLHVRSRSRKLFKWLCVCLTLLWCADVHEWKRTWILECSFLN